jgi:CDP-4-dehydro-6-deoxyglucose reductase, E3
MTFNVTNQKMGNIFTVDESETLLDGALRQGRAFNYSCRSGSCGSCQAILVSGEVDPGEFSAKALSATVQAAGGILLCQARAQSNLVIEATELPPGVALPIRTLPCRVIELEKACHDVMVLHLKLPQDQAFDYLPGQYIDILLRDGRRRSFSIANAAGTDGNLELHVRHVPGGHFTGQVFETMKVRELLRFQGPFGTFFLRENEQLPAILIAGGTGLAPIKAILENGLPINRARSFHLFWGVRSKDDLYFHDQIRAWVKIYPNLDYTPVFSEPNSKDKWDGQTGLVHEAVLHRFPDLSGVEVYASGPPPMIDALKIGFAEHGLSPERLHFDSFTFSLSS